MTHHIWTAARSVFAVVAGIAAMSAVAFAIEIPLRWLTLRLLPETFPDQAALDTNVGWMLSQSLYTVPAAMLGGYVAAWLAPRRGLAHAVAMAIVQDLLIVALIFEPPHPVPAWMWAIALVVTPAGSGERDRWAARTRMKRFAIIIVVLVTLAVAALTVLDTLRSRSFVRRVQSIRIGDSKERVLATLGRATTVFTPPQQIPRGLYLGVHVETWAYGKRFDWQHCFHSEFPFFWPLKFRLFGPDGDDVEVEFDSTGRVTRVSTPTT